MKKNQHLLTNKYFINYLTKYGFTLNVEKSTTAECGNIQE